MRSLALVRLAPWVFASPCFAKAPHRDASFSATAGRKEGGVQVRRRGVSNVTINSIANNRAKQLPPAALDAISAALAADHVELLESEEKRQGQAK